MTQASEAALELLLTLPGSDRLAVADFLRESVQRSRSHEAAAISDDDFVATMLARHPGLFAQADTQKLQSWIDLVTGG